MDKIHEGDIVSGIITGIEDYGIFVKVDQYNGLIHISEISHNFVKNVNDYAKIGNTIDMKVIEINERNKQLKLSLKEFEKNIPKKEKIIETKSGFSSLENRLENWISDKLTEIKLKN